jgi:hypothetical protein
VKAREVRVRLEVALVTCSAPLELADQLQAGFEGAGMRAFRETGRCGRVALRAYRFGTLEPLVEPGEVPDPPRFERVAAAVTEAAERRIAGGGLYDVATAGRWPWVAVFYAATLTRTGIELLLAHESEADEQLPLLALALGLERKEIEIKPPISWGYGHPDLRPDA